MSSTVSNVMLDTLYVFVELFDLLPPLGLIFLRSPEEFEFPSTRRARSVRDVDPWMVASCQDEADKMRAFALNSNTNTVCDAN